MAVTYCTEEELSEYTGVGELRTDENVGTGDNSETSFDLDENNIIGTPVISHAGSGSNDFTALTLTTHYSLDKRSGRILLSTAGKTELGTDVLYASYYFGEDITDSMCTNWIEDAEEEVDEKTGRYWGTSKTVTDYYDGRDTIDYPSTDRPFDSNVWEEKPYLMLKEKPVLSVSNVYFLKRGCVFTKVFSYDTGTSAFTDETSDANSPEESTFFPFGSSPATGDIAYFGSGYKFMGLTIDLSILGTGSPVIDWEYYNGSAWADITETESTTGSSTFEASGKFTWTSPDSWTKNTVNGTSAYWIRGKVSTTYTISPKINQASMDQDNVIREEVRLSSVDVNSFGKLTFLDKSIPDGVRNVKVKYLVGNSSVPRLVKELTVLFASLRVFSRLTGGSYNEFTSATLGSKAYTQGEQYVNIREVFIQTRKRISDVLRMLGERFDGVGS